MKFKPHALDLPNLTFLRGLAAVLIVVFHFDGIVLRLNFSEKNLFLHNCYLMVDLFFILSGFIIQHVYGQRFSTGIGWKSYFTFIKARFARVYPLHFLLLIILIIIIYGSLNPYMSGTLKDLIHDSKAILTNLFLLQSFGIHDIFTWNLPSWSISAEWWVYIIYPALALFNSKNKTLTLGSMIFLVIILYAGITYYLPRSQFLWNVPNSKNINVTFDFGYIRGFAGFICGMITYTLYEKKSLLHFLSNDAAGIGIFFLIFLVMKNGINNLFCIPLFMLLVLNMASNKNLLHKICMLKPMQFLGKISYSIYMVHYLLIMCFALPIIDQIGFHYTGPGSVSPPLIQGLFLCILFVILVIAVSSATYKFIEKPCRMWIKDTKTHTA